MDGEGPSASSGPAVPASCTGDGFATSPGSTGKRPRLLPRRRVRRLRPCGLHVQPTGGHPAGRPERGGVSWRGARLLPRRPCPSSSGFGPHVFMSSRPGERGTGSASSGERASGSSVPGLHRRTFATPRRLRRRSSLHAPRSSWGEGHGFGIAGKGLRVTASPSHVSTGPAPTASPSWVRPHGFGNAEGGRLRGGGNVSRRGSWLRRGHTRAHKGRPGHRSSWGEWTGEKATPAGGAAYLSTGQHGGRSVARVPHAGRGEQAGTSIGRALHGRKGAGAVGRGRQRRATWGKPA